MRRVATSQTVAIPSFPAAPIQRPSGENFTSVTQFFCAPRMAIGARVPTSHSRTVPSAPPEASVALSGEISSRSDVIRVLDKICEYYERFEPASPVPIFMQRAKRLVTMNFVDMIKDLAPEAMAKIEVFTGTSGETKPPA